MKAPVWSKRDGEFNGKKVVPGPEQFLAYLRARPRNPSPSAPKLLQDIDASIMRSSCGPGLTLGRYKLPLSQ